MKYQVTVTETLSRVVNIDSTSAEEAEEKVRSLYKKDVIVLDWADFQDLNIRANSDDARRIKPYFVSKKKDFTKG